MAWRSTRRFRRTRRNLISTQVLMQPSIRLQCSDIMGRYQDLSKGTLSEGHTVLPQTCLTLRHVIDESSPLHTCNGGRSNICAVLCSITAIDGVSGAPVHAAIAYVSPSAAAGDPSILPGIETKPKLCWDLCGKQILAARLRNRWIMAWIVHPTHWLIYAQAGTPSSRICWISRRTARCS